MIFGESAPGFVALGRNVDYSKPLGRRDFNSKSF
jgi:hypothetical protein